MLLFDILPPEVMLLIIWHLRQHRVLDTAARTIQRGMQRWYYADVPALVTHDSDVFFSHIGTVHFSIVPLANTEYIEDID